MSRIPTDLYLILDAAVIPHRDLLEAAQAAIAGGVRMIQYREKEGEKNKAYRTACGLHDLARKENVVFIINDDVDLTLASEADGVHLGQEDLPIAKTRSLLGPDRIIGGSAHTLGQALAAQEAGADYLGIGPIFPSPTKQARPPLGCGILSKLRHKILIPLFAIGGISEQNIPEVLSAGADGVACVSAVLSQPNIRETTQRLLQIIRFTKDLRLTK